MKITIESDTRVQTIEDDQEYEFIDDVIEMMIKPILLAMSYHPNSVKRVFRSDDDE